MWRGRIGMHIYEQNADNFLYKINAVLSRDEWHGRSSCGNEERCDQKGAPGTKDSKEKSQICLNKKDDPITDKVTS